MFLLYVGQFRIYEENLRAAPKVFYSIILMYSLPKLYNSLWRWELLKPDIPESKRGNYSLRSDTLYFFLFEINVREYVTLA